MGRWRINSVACFVIGVGVVHPALADCLDGKFQPVAIHGSISVFHNFPPNCVIQIAHKGPGTFEAECPPIPSFPGWPRPKASVTITAGPNIGSISASAEAHAIAGFTFTASVSVSVTFRAVDGAVFATTIGSHKTVLDGTVQESSIVDPTGVFAIEGEAPVTLHCTALSGVLQVVNPQPSSASCSVSMLATPTVISAIRQWVNPSGGTYHDSSNWSTNCAPAHDPPERSDSAFFNLPTDTFIPVTGTGATAGVWLVNNSMVDFQGSAELFLTHPFFSALTVQSGGKLRLSAGGSVTTPNTRIGFSGATDSSLEVRNSVGAGLTNTDTLRVGRGLLEARSGGLVGTGRLVAGTSNGTATINIAGQSSRIHTLNEAVIGDAGPANMTFDDGGLFEASQADGEAVVIGRSADATVTVESSTSVVSRMRLAKELIVGEGAKGRLQILRRGSVEAGTVALNSINPAGSGELLIDGQGGSASLTVNSALFVGATELVEMLVKGGGAVSTPELDIGFVQVRPGTADVTVQGVGSSLAVIATPTSEQPAQPVIVGFAAPGQLNVLDGASTQFSAGMIVGSGASGIVLVSHQNAPPGSSTEIVSNGETRIGSGASGIVQLTHGAKLTHNGDFKIGTGTGQPSGKVTLNINSRMDVNGTLSVGTGGQGILDILSGSSAECDTLVVGGETSQSAGLVTQTFFTDLKVNGNAQVGVAPGGFGTLLLAEDSAILRFGGTLTIGNPAGGPGVGVVTLVDATVQGTGNIVVNPNGALTGTGTVQAPKINNGGTISPGLSPGTLTIDGDLEMRPGGVLVIEYAGLAPGEFDVLQVTGQADLGGRLEIHFRDGFHPPDLRAFVNSQLFVEADGGISGDYDERIYAFPDEFADFDNDGDKDLRDAAAFMNCFGRDGDLAPDCTRADWEDDGLVGNREIRELSERLGGPL